MLTFFSSLFVKTNARGGFFNTRPKEEEDAHCQGGDQP
jgi:hypothetical protein